MSQARPVQIQHSVVRIQLEKILAHNLFARSERMGRFLRLAVERALDGKADELKEYLIGVEVFDRKQSYDPRVDPIVRVEARRLRSKLEAYYSADGQSDPILIEFPRGSYVPKIREAAAILEPTSPAAVPPRSVPDVAATAVLPFANLSASGDYEYFSDGLTEELIHALTKLPGMRVVAWNTAAQLRDRQQDLREIRRQLSVDTVLTGSVRMAGSSLRVRAQLIDTGSGVYLWSETFDRQVQDVFAIQEEIALAIVRTLHVKLSGDRQDARIGRGHSTVSSYDWYLKGRHLWRSRKPEQLKQSVACFENAIAADENSALAYAGLADTYSLLVDYGSLHPEEGFPQAKAAAQRAIALDPDLAEPHASLAFIRSVYDWQWDDAELLYHQAIALNPGYATAHHWLGCDHYAPLGRMDEALAEMTIAQQLDPLSLIIREGCAYMRMLRREFDLAIAEYRELLAFDPSFYKGYTSLGRTYAQMGNYQEALAMLNRGRSLAGDIPSILAALGQIHALLGDEAQAREFLKELQRLAKVRYVPAACFAVVHLGLGEQGRALDWLEEGAARRESQLSAVGVHPLYDPLRGQPRFDALVNRLGLN
ncbi:MAG TPA: tetratricopeptide repeat protein [Bryobacteraceae bacterium]|nr:tetratricopeptide repeat protein [Bryobacteraceae bacterium]